jgi:hypothetical protein
MTKKVMSHKPPASGAPAHNKPGQDFRIVARLIAKGEPPSWLEGYFRDYGPSLALDEGVSKKQPTRKVMRKRLLEIGGAASILEKALAETATREFLETVGGLKIENLGEFQRSLKLIAKHAGEVANSDELVTDRGTVKQGRGPATPSASLDTKTFCAVMVMEAWKFVNGAYPGPRSQGVAKACEALWGASVSKRSSWGDKAEQAWRPYLRRATENNQSDVHRECRRQLMLRKAHESPSTE